MRRTRQTSAAPRRPRLVRHRRRRRDRAARRCSRRSCRATTRCAIDLVERSCRAPSRRALAGHRHPGARRVGAARVRRARLARRRASSRRASRCCSASRSASIAGYYGGWVDELVMRLADVTLAFPTLLLLIAMVAALQPSLTVVFVTIGVVGWAGMARLVRGQVLVVRQLEYVQASSGARRARRPHHAAARAAQRHRAGGHRGHARRRRRDHGRVGAVVPRARRAAADAELGRDDRRRPRPRSAAARAVDVASFPASRSAPRCSASTCSATRCATRSIRAHAAKSGAIEASSRRRAPDRRAYDVDGCGARSSRGPRAGEAVYLNTASTGPLPERTRARAGGVPAQARRAAPALARGAVRGARPLPRARRRADRRDAGRSR